MPYPKASQTATIVLSETGGTDFLRIRGHVSKSDENEGVLEIVVGSVEKTRATSNAIYGRLRNETQGKNYFGYPVGSVITRKQVEDDLTAFSLVNVLVPEATYTTVGGDANETVALASVKSTDTLSTVTFVDNPHTRTIVSAVTASGAVNIVLSGDPQNDTTYKFTVYRPAVITIINQ